MLLNIFDNKIHFLSMKRLRLSAVHRTQELRPGMRIVFRWSFDDHLNENPEWGRIVLVEHTHSTIAKLVIQIDTAYEVDGVLTNKIVYNVRSNQHASFWCIYDVEGESINFREACMNGLVSLADGDSDIYAALLHYEYAKHAHLM